MNARDFRADVLRAHGATEAEAEELLAYGQSPFEIPAESGPFPLPDEPFVAAWESYAHEAETRGAWAVLRERLVQLRFPVAAGVSATDAYQAATKRGIPPPESGDAVRLRARERLEIRIHPTPAGHLPVVIADDREDFVTLVRALARRNEPDPIPASMGACIVAGFNNWDRVASLRGDWERENPGTPGDGWAARFREIVPRKELYQDRFVLLSRSPYSGVPAAALGVDDGEWADLSLRIRLEHECTHYFTRRVFGSMRNTVHDELIADYMGIAAAAGRFRPDWLLRFLGMEDFPRFREGGRLANYRGKPPLGDAAFRVLQSLVHAAVSALAAFDRARTEAWTSPEEKARIIALLASTTLEELASAGAGERLRETAVTAATPG
ncbi:MAG TPA: hypothetical protein VFE05_19045 [Longimicrobiaceae bacterium]|jgi:hypothetical protein|nr:hypothetical protein [Longimicrobiaceae bacterium]